MATLEETYKRDIAFKADFVLTASGDLDTVAGLDNVKEALLRRLMTTNGALIHRPTYGVGVKRYQNILSSIANQRKLAIAIEEQFNLDPRVEKVIGVAIKSANDKPESLLISIKVRLVGYGDKILEVLPFEEEE